MQNASEDRKQLEFEITPDSRLYVRYDKIEYFFSTISGEYQRYEEIAYNDFISQKGKTFDKDNNIIIWSSDEKKVDYLVVIEWVE